MKTILIISTVLICGTAQAESYGMHLGSYHTEPGHNNFNPGLYVRTADLNDMPVTLQAGAYKNSIGHNTAYVAGNLSYGGTSLTLGAATGYLLPVIPILVLSQRVDHFRLSYVPKYSALNKGHTFHISYEF